MMMIWCILNYHHDHGDNDTYMCRDPKELHKNIDTTGSVDQLDYLEQVRKIFIPIYCKYDLCCIVNLYK